MLIKNYLIIILLFFGLLNCQSLDVRFSGTYHGGHYCMYNTSNLKGFNTPLSQFKIENDKILNLRFTEKSILFANAFGLIPLLHRLIELEQKMITDPSNLNKNEYMETEIKLNRMLARANMEVSSTVTEILCYADRIKEIVKVVRTQEDTANKKYTALSITFAAVFAILSGMTNWETNSIQAVVGIIGGATVGTIGYKSIHIDSQIKYYSIKKLLNEIWYKPKISESYPSPIWYLLNQSSQRSKTKDSLRDILVDRWRKNGYLGQVATEERNKLIQLYFDETGMYTVNQLETRKEMLNEIATQINLLQQDIRNLYDEL